MALLHNALGGDNAVITLLREKLRHGVVGNSISTHISTGFCPNSRCTTHGAQGIAGQGMTKDTEVSLGWLLAP